MKKIFRYIIIYFPFLLGIIMFSLNIVNLISSFCLFIGGYIAIKNTFDYRLVKKNREIINAKSYKKENLDLVTRKIKPRKRERIRVRKK